MAVAPPSWPEFRYNGEPEELIANLVQWFHENFEDPAESLPYETRDGGYTWLFGGPYTASEELQNTFPQLSPDIIEAAVRQIESDGIHEWTVNSSRIEEDYDVDAVEVTNSVLSEYDGSEKRDLPPGDDPHGYTVVETTLLPRRNFGWSVHATFIPVRTNKSLSEVVEVATEDGLYGRDDYQFESLRHLVATLVGMPLLGSVVGRNPDLEGSHDWIQGLSSDDRLFVDDGVIVHASPPEWLPLREIFKHGSVGGVALISQSPSNVTGVLLMYGGSLLFLRLVRNLNFLQDAFTEQWVKKIKKGKFNPF